MTTTSRPGRASLRPWTETHRDRRRRRAQAARGPTADRGRGLGRPSDAALTFVIDVSGSIAEPARLDLVQDALNVLIDQLRPTDSVAIGGP